MARRRLAEHERIDQRSFHRLYVGHILPRLSCALIAHTYAEAPPFARLPGSEDHDPRMLDDQPLGHWLDTRIGTHDQREVARGMWSVLEGYRLHADRGGGGGGGRDGRAPAPMGHHMVVALPMMHPDHGADDASADHAAVTTPMRVTCSSYSCVYQPSDVWRYDPSFMLSVGHDARIPVLLLEPTERAEMAAWATRLMQRRREAFLAMCFLGMLARNEGVATTSVLRAFPWLRGALTSLGVKRDAVAASDLPWRGHDEMLHAYVGHATPTKAGAAFMPTDPLNIVRYMQKLGEGAINGILARMSVARTAYSNTRDQQPQRIIALGNPVRAPECQSDIDGANVETRAYGVVPEWVARYAGPFEDRASTVHAKFPEWARIQFNVALRDAEVR